MAAEAKDPVIPDSPGDLIEDGKGFRITCRKLLLTYAQADNLSRDRLSDGLRQAGVAQAHIGHELHADGGTHYHCLIRLAAKKPDIRSCRHFDIDGFHPNVRRVRNEDHAYAYASKDGDTFGFGDLDVAVSRGKIAGFKRFAEDLQAYTRHVRTRSLRSPFPFTVPHLKVGTASFPAPVASERQRCLYIFGPPNTGKTKWATDTFDGSKTYYPLDGELSYDNYSGEQLIVYDDKVPSLPELIQVLNYSAHPKPAPGRQRYAGKELPGGQVRFVIIIANRVRPWEAGCSTSRMCDCPGCTRCIYFDWEQHYDPAPLLQNALRIDFA